MPIFLHSIPFVTSNPGTCGVAGCLHSAGPVVGIRAEGVLSVLRMADEGGAQLPSPELEA
jgi:hypothetical protein